MQASARVHLRLLGRLAVAADAEFTAPIRLARKKAAALVAILAMSPDQAASREQLAALLWGDCTDRQARHSLRQALVSLRQLLPEADLCSAQPDVIRLRPQAWCVDALRFEELSRSSQPEHLAGAAQLFRGDFLDGFRLDQEGFEEWAQTQRSRVQTAAARLCETCLQMPDPIDRGEAAVAVVERLLAIDPLREDWQRLALRLYARYRGQHEALAQAKLFEAQLRRELDVDPEPATQALIDEIGRCSPVRPPVVAQPTQTAVNGSNDPNHVANPTPAAAQSANTNAPPTQVRASSALRMSRPRALAAAVIAVAVIVVSASLLIGRHGHFVWWPFPAQSKGITTREPDIDHLLGAGTAAQMRNNPVEALPFFEEALRLQPGSARALTGAAAQLVLGGTTYQFDRKPSLDRAEQLLLRSVQLNPDGWRTHYWLGIIQRVHRRDYEASLRSLLRVLELNPSHASSHANIGRTLAMMGRLDDARPHFAKAQRMSPNDPGLSYWLFFAGEAELEAGDDAAALNSFQRAVKLAPHNPRLHGSLAATYALMGDAANAAIHAAEVKRLSHSKSFTDLIEDIAKTHSGRRTTQPRLMDGLRLALAVTQKEGIAAKGLTWQRFATAGQEVMLNGHSSIDGECRPHGTPVVTVVTAPAHGTINVRERTVVVGPLQRGKLGTQDCQGITNQGIGVYYRPEPDYQGADRVTYRVSFPSTIYFEDTIDIMVFR